VAGVSTRKVDQAVESLGLRISKSEASRICAGLDEQVDAFCNRPLEGSHPDLWLDAKVEKVRDGGRVVRKALVLAYAVHESGCREVIGSISARPRRKRSGAASCARWSSAVSSACSWSSPTRRPGSRRRSARCSAAPGSERPLPARGARAGAVSSSRCWRRCSRRSSTPTRTSSPRPETPRSSRRVTPRPGT
jgi:hypothetical protein